MLSKGPLMKDDPSKKLKGVNVLVDGYNLELKEGTGVKTYGVTLIKALNLLGANTKVLFSTPIETKDSLLQEVLLFDYQKGTAKRWELATEVFKALAGIGYGPKKVAAESKIVIKPSGWFLENAEIFAAPNCYRIAHLLHKYIGMTLGLRMPDRVHVWHATYPLPMRIRGAKTISTIHDLIPLILPYTTLDDKKVYLRLIRYLLRYSDLIIAVSENTKRDIMRIFGVDGDKIFVTYQPTYMAPLDEEEKCLLPTVLRKYRLKEKGYILFVGAIEPKKNVGRLVDAYAMLDTNLSLAIVGKKGWLWEGEIGKLEGIFGKRWTEKIKLLEFVSFVELRYLYAGAVCLVFPSLYEGFGLPPLEAMAMGCPVITSRVASLPEVCGNAALYVDPYDVMDIKSRMEEIIGDPKLREELSIAGMARAKAFDMDSYMQRLCQAYMKIL